MEHRIKKPTSMEKELKENVISFRLTPSELIELERAMANASIKNRAQFIKTLIFNQPIKVVKVDQNLMEYLVKLNNLQAEYRAIGNNYNQVTKAIKTAFSEKKALAFLHKLQDQMVELIKLNNQIKELTEKIKQK